MHLLFFSPPDDEEFESMLCVLVDGCSVTESFWHLNQGDLREQYPGADPVGAGRPDEPGQLGPAGQQHLRTHTRDAREHQVPQVLVSRSEHCRNVVFLSSRALLSMHRVAQNE